MAEVRVGGPAQHTSTVGRIRTWWVMDIGRSGHETVLGVEGGIETIAKQGPALTVAAPSHGRAHARDEWR
jgi:hypothetical protein